MEARALLVACTTTGNVEIPAIRENTTKHENTVEHEKMIRKDRISERREWGTRTNIETHRRASICSANNCVRWTKHSIRSSEYTGSITAKAGSQYWIDYLVWSLTKTYYSMSSCVLMISIFASPTKPSKPGLLRASPDSTSCPKASSLVTIAKTVLRCVAQLIFPWLWQSFLMVQVPQLFSVLLPLPKASILSFLTCWAY